jgi:hypothetical protein
MKKIILLLVSVCLLVPFLSQAQIKGDVLDKINKNSQAVGNLGSQANAPATDQIDKYIGTVIGFILSFVGVIFLLLIIIAGFVWLTAQGDKTKIESAKKLMVNGVIGAVVCFGVFVIVNTFLAPLTSRYFIPPQFSQVGGALTPIDCSVDAQCADQTTRKICIDNNCLECLNNDQDNNTTSSVCKQYYGVDKSVCDSQNHVCILNPTTACSALQKTTCLARTDCYWDYSWTLVTNDNLCQKKDSVPECSKINAQQNCENQNHCRWDIAVAECVDACHSSITQDACELSTNCEWQTKWKLNGECIKKSDYGITCPQCTDDKPFCLTTANPKKCVECRDDSDCQNNLLNKTCSVYSGNYICVPF